jgi:hypothetical protein
MFPSVNTGYIYAPKEMFEVSAPVGTYGPQFYIYGFWGFIQIYDHAIVAMENVSYNSLSPNPVVDKRVNATAGRYNDPGYTNAIKIESARFNAPKGLALDKTIGPTMAGVGNGYTRPTLFVADSSNHCIRMISVTITPFYGPNANPKEGIIGVSTLTGSNFPGPGINPSGPKTQILYATAGYKDGNFSQALFNNPIGLDFDSNGVLYVADNGNNVIRKIVIDQPEVNMQYKLDYTGTVTTLKVPELVAPTGVLFYNGFLYVCDRSTIRKIDVLNPKPNPKFNPSSNVLDPEIYDVQIIAGGFRLPPPPEGQDLSQVQNPYGMVFSGKNLLFSDVSGVKILVNAGQMPPVIRPAPYASFSPSQRPQALMEYQGNIVVGLKGSYPVQISGGQNCTCYLDIPGNCA